MSNTKKRYIWYWVYTLLERVAPMIFIAVEFGIFRDNVSLFKKMTGIAILMITFLATAYYKDFIKWSKTLDNSIKHLAKSTRFTFFLLISICILWWAKSGIDSLVHLSIFWFICSLVALYPKIKHARYLELTTQENLTTE